MELTAQGLPMGSGALGTLRRVGVGIIACSGDGWESAWGAATGVMERAPRPPLTAPPRAFEPLVPLGAPHLPRVPREAPLSVAGGAIVELRMCLERILRPVMQINRCLVK